MIKMLSLDSLLPLAQQAAPAPTSAPASGVGPGPMNLLFFVFMAAALWFLMIAPQRKKQKEQQKMINSLSPGDEILTVGGIYGEITSVRPDRLVVRIGDNAKVEVEKSFIHTVVRKSGQPAPEKK
jgi:preprotein translocase subunit YajC